MPNIILIKYHIEFTKILLLNTKVRRQGERRRTWPLVTSCEVNGDARKTCLRIPFVIPNMVFVKPQISRSCDASSYIGFRFNFVIQISISIESFLLSLSIALFVMHIEVQTGPLLILRQNLNTVAMIQCSDRLCCGTLLKIFQIDPMTKLGIESLSIFLISSRTMNTVQKNLLENRNINS